jgi:hypothetical protein
VRRSVPGNWGRKKEAPTHHSVARNFAGLAKTWVRLAEDLERTQVILDAMDDETEPNRRTG